MSQQKKWHQLERGQSMMEYWPTLPAAVMIVISAGLIVTFLQSAFSQTAEVLNRSSAGVRIEVCETTEDDLSDPVVTVGTHTFEVVSKDYDEDSDVTIITYKVTSSQAQSLSHWTLGLDEEVAGNILQVLPKSEAWGWTDNDPQTGAAGIKFDTGYDGGGTADTTTDADSGPPEGKGKKNTTMSRYIPSLYLLQDETTTEINIADGETREITLMLQGSYDFGDVTVTTKSGSGDSGVAEGTVLGPVVTVIDHGYTETVITEGCE